MDVINDPTLPGELRFEAARKAAPYVHPKLAPVALQPAEPQYALDLTKLTDEELAFFARIVAKAQIVYPESEADQLPKLIDDNTAEE
jgi:hypothetical protein